MLFLLLSYILLYTDSFVLYTYIQSSMKPVVSLRSLELTKINDIDSNQTIRCLPWKENLVPNNSRLTKILIKADQNVVL